MNEEKEMQYKNRLFIVISLAAIVGVAACGQNSAIADQGIPSTPDGTVKYVVSQMADGKPGIIWQALPSRYQTDINNLTHEFANKMDPEVWAKSFAVTRKAAGVLQDKKELFLESQMMQMAQDKQDDIAANWDTFTLVMSTLAASELGNLDSLKTVDWGIFLSTTGAQLMTIAAEASAKTEENAYEKDFLAKARAMQVAVVNQEGDTATLKITAPDEEPEEVQLTRVDGRWVPADMAKDWDKNVAEARAELEAITPEKMAEQKMQIMMMVGMAEAFVDQIAQAQTSEQLDQMLQGIFGGLMGGMMGGPPASDEAEIE
jgi:hypothetical protein